MPKKRSTLPPDAVEAPLIPPEGTDPHAAIASFAAPLKTRRAYIRDLYADGRNARRHNRDNLRAIAASLKEFGQRKPLVVFPREVAGGERDGWTVIAGNGTLRAMKALGWTEADVVDFAGTEKQARAFALADNRSAELAEWDDDELARQLREQILDFDLEAFGFDDRELAKRLKRSMELPEFEDAAANGETGLRYRIVIDCDSEEHQAELLDRLELEGLECKPLIS